MNKTELLKIAKGIRMQTWEVKAMLDGRKSETRRPIRLPKWVTEIDKEKGKFHFSTGKQGDGDSGIVGADGLISYLNLAPYQKGDILYVQETFWEAGYYCQSHPEDDELSVWVGSKRYFYHAEGEPPNEPNKHYPTGLRNGKYSAADPNRLWRKLPSIHMPKEAARIFLRVTDVKVERVQEITDESAKAEGVNNGVGCEEKMKHSARERFRDIWYSLYGDWDSNPWIWIIKFERVTA